MNINNFRGDLTDVSAKTTALAEMDNTSDFFFKIKQNLFFDTLTLKIRFFARKINNFRGDLTDSSAKKAALQTMCKIDVYSRKWKPVLNSSSNRSSRYLTPFCTAPVKFLSKFN